MNVGDPVELIQSHDKGRICHDFGLDSYCVQFAQPLGCRRVAGLSLKLSTEPAPPCTDACSSGQCP